MKILLVEDNQIAQIVCKNILNILGYSITIVENGSRAVELGCTDFDIIFMDIGLPDISGIDATEQIIKQRTIKLLKSIPIIGISAHASINKQAECLKAGMINLLQKPLTLDSFKEQLEQVVN